MRSIEGQCAALGVSTLPVLLRGAQLGDTYHEKLLKSQLVTVDDAFRQFVLSWYEKGNGDREKQFEECFERLDIGEEFESMRQRCVKARRVFEFNFVTQLNERAVKFDEMVFIEPFLRMKLKIDERGADFQRCKGWKEKFMEALATYAVGDKFRDLGEKIRYVNTAELRNFDALTMGEKLLALNDMLEAIEVLYVEKQEVEKELGLQEEAHELDGERQAEARKLKRLHRKKQFMFSVTCQVLAGAKCSSLYESLVIILIFLHKNPNVYDELMKKRICERFVDTFKHDGLLVELLEVRGPNGPLFLGPEKFTIKIALGL
jgi:hypothetical protein